MTRDIPPCLGAIYALSVGFEGFCLTSVTWPERIGWLIAGFLLFIPGISSDIPGFFLFLVLFLVQWFKRKREVSKIG